MKPSASVLFSLSLLCALAPTYAAEPVPPTSNAETDAAAQVAALPEAIPMPSIKSLDKPIENFAITLAATTMMLAADLSDESKMGDPFITAITYGQVLQILLTNESQASLPPEYKSYFDDLLALEMEAIAELVALESENPAFIFAITTKLEGKKLALLEKYPVPATLFNDLNTFIGAVIEQYELADSVNQYRSEHQEVIALSAERETGMIFRFMASVLTTATLIGDSTPIDADEAEEVEVEVTPDELLADPLSNTIPDLSQLDQPIQKLIEDIASMSLDIAADFADQSLLGDPILKAATYGSVLQILMSDEYLAKLPQEHQAYFRTLMSIELQLMESIAAQDAEDIIQIHSLIAQRDKDKAQLLTQFPQAAPVFNDLHALIAAVMKQFHMMEAIEQHRRSNPEMQQMQGPELTAAIFRFMSSSIAQGLHDYRQVDKPDSSQ